MQEELKKIIKKSGNNLHIAVVELLEKMQWDVDLSSYYYDDTANKPREIDIIAKKNIPIINPTTQAQCNEFNLFLFIECKHFTKEVAFRSRLNREQEAKEAITIEANEAVDGWSKEVILEREGLFRNHHYLKERFIGKLYDTENEKPVFNAITQPIKSLIFFKESRCERGVYYPLVVYSGTDGIYSIKRQDSDLEKIKPKKRLIFGLNYSYKPPISGVLKTNQFYIDFVHQDELGSFIEDTILEEIKELKEYLFFRKRTHNV